MENLEWLDIKTTSGIPITSYYLIDDKIVISMSTLKNKIFGNTENSRRVKSGLSR